MKQITKRIQALAKRLKTEEDTISYFADRNCFSADIDGKLYLVDTLAEIKEAAKKFFLEDVYPPVEQAMKQGILSMHRESQVAEHSSRSQSLYESTLPEREYVEWASNFIRTPDEVYEKMNFLEEYTSNRYTHQVDEFYIQEL